MIIFIFRKIETRHRWCWRLKETLIYRFTPAAWGREDDKGVDDRQNVTGHESDVCRTQRRSQKLQQPDESETPQNSETFMNHTLTSEIKTHHTERRRDIEQQEEDDEDDQSADDVEQVQNLSGDHLNKHDSEPLLILINHSKWRWCFILTRHALRVQAAVAVITPFKINYRHKTTLYRRKYQHL